MPRVPRLIDSARLAAQAGAGAILAARAARALARRRAGMAGVPRRPLRRGGAAEPGGGAAWKRAVGSTAEGGAAPKPAGGAAAEAGSGAAAEAGSGAAAEAGSGAAPDQPAPDAQVSAAEIARLRRELARELERASGRSI